MQPAVCDNLQSFGFACIASLGGNQPGPLTTAWQAEAAAALERAELHCGGSIQDVVRHTGCILQVLPELGPSHPARTSPEYWQLRSEWPCQQGAAAFLQSQPLLELLANVLGCNCDQLLLYNEQYIVKPPNLSLGSAFGWHYDSQASRAASRGVAHSPYLSLWVALDDMTADNGCLVLMPGARGESCCRCVSKCTQDMTYIQASSTHDCMAQLAAMQQQHQHQHQHQHQQQSCVVTGADSVPATQHPAQEPPQQQDAGTATSSSSCLCPQAHLPPVGLLMPAGSAVLFWDDLWHCSGPNHSSHTRTAYMAQFSSKPLTWADTGELVGLAVPLMPV